VHFVGLFFVFKMDLQGVWWGARTGFFWFRISTRGELLWMR